MIDVLRILLDRLEEAARDLGKERQMRAAAEQKTERISYSSADVVALIENIATPGKKIEAIKLYRQMTGYGLKESKDAIDRVMNQFPPKASAA